MAKATVAFTVTDNVGPVEIRTATDGRNRAYCNACKRQIHKVWMTYDVKVAVCDAQGHVAREHG
jgi:hypothetical protein